MTSSGNVNYEVKSPEDWGLSEFSCNPNGSAEFYFHPLKGGYGAKASIYSFSDSIEASNQVKNLKADFASIQSLENGFEAHLKKAQYSCIQNGRFVIETWYPRPKNKNSSLREWDVLKQSIKITEENLATDEYTPIKEIPKKGWIITHPDNDLYIVVNKAFCFPAKQNTDTSRSHLIELSALFSSAYFYLEWDQENLDTIDPYNRHLLKISKELLKHEEEQYFENEIKSDLKEGWAIKTGFPYTLITIAGDKFLFGFAIKKSNHFSRLNINDYIKLVKWNRKSAQ